MSALRTGFATFVVAVLSVPWAPAAHAAVPGSNGYIAFESSRTGNGEIFSMLPDGTAQTNLTNNAAGSAPELVPGRNEARLLQQP